MEVGKLYYQILKISKWSCGGRVASRSRGDRVGVERGSGEVLIGHLGVLYDWSLFAWLTVSFSLIFCSI